MKQWRRRNKKGAALLSAAVLFLAGCGVMRETQSPADETLHSTEGAAQGARKVTLAGDDVELHIRPQDDFYGYVNAEKLMNMSVAYGESTAGGFQDTFEEIDGELSELILGIVNSEETYRPGSDEHLIREYYKLYSSGSRTDKRIIDRMFSGIDGIQNTYDLVRVSGELSYRYGVRGIYSFKVETDPFQPEERLLILSHLDTFQENLKEIYEEDDQTKAFRDELEDMLAGLGAGYDEARERANRIAYLWLDIAAETDFEALEREDIERLADRYSVSDMAELLPVADCREFLKNYGMTDAEIQKIQELAVYLPDQMKQVKALITQDNLEIWKDYLRCAVCHTYAAFLPEGYTLEDRDTEPLDQRDILGRIKKDCYENLGSLYCEKYYTQELADYMERMKKDITEGYMQMIRGADWLTPQGRDLFMEKFGNIHFFFGGQEKQSPDPREAEIIGDTLLETMVNRVELDMRYQFESLFQPVDIAQWKMGAQEVNAYFDPKANSIYISTAIMHAPFFDPKADYAANLGGIGAVICHELSHAFDNMGILYDQNGRYAPSWVPQADRDAFAGVVAKVDAHYDNYTLLDVYHVDGEKTVGENLADLGAVQCVLSLAGTEEQREKLFENYAKIWCTLYQKDDLLLYLTRDVHSPDPIRVNAVLSCFDEFYELYHVTPEDGMYLAPEGRIKRW